jgi:hypothetical protein
MQLYGVLDQTLAARLAARKLMFEAAKSFPKIALSRDVPGVGPNRGLPH